MGNNRKTNALPETENIKRTGILPVKGASIKFFANKDEIYEDAKTSPPFIRKFHINSLKQDIAEKSAFKFIFTALILSISLAWIGEFSGIESIWLSGFYLGIVLTFAILSAWGLSIANINMSKYYTELFSRFPGNSKTKFYIRELEKLES